MIDDIRPEYERLEGLLRKMKNLTPLDGSEGEASFHEIVAAAQTGPLVYLTSTVAGGLALIVFPSGEVECIELPLLSRDTLNEVMLGDIDRDDAEELFSRLTAGTESDSDRILASAHFGVAYSDWRSRMHDADATERWCVALELTGRWLWKAAMELVSDGVVKRGFDYVVLLPDGWLSFLPWSAAWTESERVGGRTYVIDRIEISLAPSARSIVLASKEERANGQRVIGMADPTGSLRFAAREVETVLERMPRYATTLLQGNECTVGRVLKELERATIAHFSTHTTGSTQDQSTFGLVLARGEKLTRVELRSASAPNLELAVLSGCDTGVANLQLPNEHISLPSAFLDAGARGVVATNWPVDDLSTSVLMNEFYGAMVSRSLPASSALREAQLAMRAPKPPSGEPTGHWSHPFFWAGFSYWGPPRRDRPGRKPA